MQLDILSTLNAERAARRAVLVVTETENGRQRLVKGEDAARDPLKDFLLKRLRQRQKRDGGDAARQGVPHRACAAAAPCDHRRGAYQSGAGADGEDAQLRRDHCRSAHGFCFAGTLSRPERDRGMAGHGAAAA